LGFARERSVARVDDVESTMERLGVDDFDGSEFALAEFLADRDQGQETEAQLALHHALGCLDGLDFKNYVRQKTRAAEEALAERPIA